MDDKKYKCENCGSESMGEAGDCCGGERKMCCEKCDHSHKEDGSCDCGCD